METYKRHKIEKRADGYVYYSPASPDTAGHTGRVWASVKGAKRHIDILCKLDKVKAAQAAKAAEKKPARKREWK